MKRLTLAAILVAAGPAFGDVVATIGGDSIRLTGNPCTNETVLQHVPAEARDKFMAASAIVGGHSFTGCWRPYRKGEVHLVYEDGDEGIMPLAAFKSSPGI
jgi:hypothetical protein